MMVSGCSADKKTTSNKISPSPNFIKLREVVRAFNNIAHHLELSREDILCVNYLFALTDDADWKNNNPLIITSFQELMTVFEMSSDVLSKHLSTLTHANLIKVSRSEVENEAGEMIEACTIDLSLLQQRTPEFEWLNEAIYYEEMSKRENSFDTQYILKTLSSLINSVVWEHPGRAFKSLKERIDYFLNRPSPVLSSPASSGEPSVKKQDEKPQKSTYTGFIGAWPHQPLYEIDQKNSYQETDQPDCNDAFDQLTQILNTDEGDEEMIAHEILVDPKLIYHGFTEQPAYSLNIAFCPIEKTAELNVHPSLPKIKRSLSRYGLKNVSYGPMRFWSSKLTAHYFSKH